MRPKVLRLFVDFKIMSHGMSDLLFRLLAAIFAVVLHECGHLLMAFSCGLKVKKVGVSRLGVYVTREAGPKAANISILLAGPLLNLLLAAAFSSVWPTFALMNLINGVLNLFPFPHSDGSQVRAILFNPILVQPVSRETYTPTSSGR